MIARITVLALLAVAVSAVNLQHAVPKLSVQEMNGNPFATAVLAELNSHLAAGGPADELLKIVADIRQRVQDAAQADSDGWATRKAECEAQKKRLDGLIAAKEKEITENLNNQENVKAEMAEFKAEWDRLESEMTAKQQQIDDKQAEIDELDAKRKYEEEVFTNRTRDTEECITAIQDILALEGNDLLASSQADNVDSVNAAYDYEKKDTTISEVAPSGAVLVSIASKLHNQASKALMQDAIDNKYNYDDLANLLAKLEEELHKYAQELKDAEAEAIATYTTTRAAAVDVLNGYKKELVDLTAQRDFAKASFKKKEGELAQLQEEHRQLVLELNALNRELDNWTTTCTTQEEEYNQRVADRSSELDTLDAIENLIRDRLGHLIDGNKSTKTQDDVQDRLENGPNPQYPEVQ